MSQSLSIEQVVDLLPPSIVLDNVLHDLRPFGLPFIIDLVFRQHLEDVLESVLDFYYFLTHGEIERAQIDRIAPVVVDGNTV